MMDRAQFMQELEKLLADISETERQDALDFYNSYFDDAGAENEASVLRELGSPEKVAAIIKADLKGSAGGYEYGEYTEHGYEDARTKERVTYSISAPLFYHFQCLWNYIQVSWYGYTTFSHFLLPPSFC